MCVVPLCEICTFVHPKRFPKGGVLNSFMNFIVQLSKIKKKKERLKWICFSFILFVYKYTHFFLYPVLNITYAWSDMNMCILFLYINGKYRWYNCTKSICINVQLYRGIILVYHANKIWMKKIKKSRVIFFYFPLNNYYIERTILSELSLFINIFNFNVFNVYFSKALCKSLAMAYI